MRHRAAAVAVVTAIILLLFSCNQDKRRAYQINSVGWTIKVPDTLKVWDSLAFTTMYIDGLPPSNREVPLLRIFDSTQFRIGAPNLMATIKHFAGNEQTWTETLQTFRTEWARNFNKAFLPKVTIDSIYSTEIVDHLKFDKTVFKLTREHSVEYVHIYSQIINGYEFHCAINFIDTVIGNKYLDMFRKSSFSLPGE